jgi:hypothetical protein
MSSSILRRLIVVIALCAFLGAPATSLAGPRSAARFSEDRTANMPLLARLLNAVVSAWEKEGCSIDPYGRCAPKSQTTKDSQKSADAGCSIDPYGRCLTGALGARAPENQKQGT